ncbi:ECF RNA polymerase sigma factor SigK [Agrococcus jejuensis]|uniref:RNA polymerase, sigma subunit, ECF family n=1 Tax=Agrococcus jejuensis TaxID=399736 RepID=A0A1G8GSZ3_9MICO|nr:ECF RNA polymerase sigma factor SigK [Agrococcus jejuensis]SDH97391.1 RNA polymerase, sigma subunit, ECF family [Agrococcus jejuensis]
MLVHVPAVPESSPVTPTRRATDVDDALVRVAGGDREAFAVVYDALSARVFGLVLRVLVDRSQAEEVTQEVFVDMWRKAKTFDPARGSSVGWALALAHSKAVDRVRSSQAQRDRDERIGIRDSVAPFDVVSESADVKVEGARVREALATLTEAHREAIVLAYYGGLTQTEIAERLETPLGTVKTRLRDGMIRLRAALGVS